MSSETNSCEGENVCSKLEQENDNIIKSRLHGDIKKKTLQRGKDFIKPQWESTCIFDVSVDQNEKTSERAIELENDLVRQGEKNMEIVLGQSATELMRRVETCLLTMSEGEVSSFVFNTGEPKSPESANNEDRPIEGGVLHENLPVEKETMCLTISLHKFSQALSSWKLSSDEKYKLALSYKTQGTELFQSGKLDAAFARYSRAAKYLICIPELSTVSDTGLVELPSTCSVALKDLKTLQCVCHLNLAVCQAKVLNHAGVIENCTRALALDSGSVKALYRRAVAHLACGNKSNARSDLLRAQKLEPKNKAVHSLLQTCQL